jgi:hypothetical protein
MHVQYRSFMYKFTSMSPDEDDVGSLPLVLGPKLGTQKHQETITCQGHSTQTCSCSV